MNDLSIWVNPAENRKQELGWRENLSPEKASDIISKYTGIKLSEEVIKNCGKLHMNSKPDAFGKANILSMDEMNGFVLRILFNKGNTWTVSVEEYLNRNTIHILLEASSEIDKVDENVKLLFKEMEELIRKNGWKI
jgi:hypothetical protein